MKKEIDLNNKRVLISRIDSIGDVLLTLPLCSWIKQNFPTCTVLFLGKSYTLPILKSYQCIDGCYNWDEFKSSSEELKVSRFKSMNITAVIHVFPVKEIAFLAKKVGIPFRIGTSHRGFHLLTCNQRINFSRKRSELHEAQLNYELLRPLGLKQLPTFDELIKSTDFFKPSTQILPRIVNQFVETYPRLILLHPKSQGSAVEWPVEKYMELAIACVDKGYGVCITGTETEGKQFLAKIPKNPHILNSTGCLTLEQLITLIGLSEGIVACSTGPLHIGGFLGVKTIGLYSPKRPIHPGRWRPIGNNVTILVHDEKCMVCRAGKKCGCIERIQVEKVLDCF